VYNKEEDGDDRNKNNKKIAEIRKFCFSNKKRKENTGMTIENVRILNSKF